MRTKTTLLLYKSRLFGQNSDVSERSQFDYPKEKKKKRGGHKIKCLLTELDKYLAIGHDLGPIFSRPVRPNSVNKYVMSQVFTEVESIKVNANPKGLYNNY